MVVVVASTAPTGLKKGNTVTSLTSLLDVYPTLIALSGGTPLAFLRGHSLLPLMAQDATETAPEAARGEYPEDRYVTAQA
jgi:arylsulfatase A-like enzyme